jgi:response regulator NasT
MRNNPLRIVVADDEAVICSFFRTTLERMGHVVVATAHDGDSLVAACRKHAPDLVVTDLRMPGRDGIWAAEELERLNNIPVIVLSAFHEPDLINMTTAQNIHGYLVKPVKPDDLEMAIAIAMRKAAKNPAAVV